MKVARDIVTVMVALLVAFVGLSLQFSDFGGWETLYSRAVLVGCYFCLAGFLLGYFRPQRWALALFAAVGGFLWVYPAVLAAATAFVGARVRAIELLGSRQAGWLIQWSLNIAAVFVVTYLPELLPIHWSTLAALALVLGLANAALSSWTGRQGGSRSLSVTGLIIFVVDAISLGVAGAIKGYAVPVLPSVIQGVLLAVLNVALLVTVRLPKTPSRSA